MVLLFLYWNPVVVGEGNVELCNLHPTDNRKDWWIEFVRVLRKLWQVKNTKQMQTCKHSIDVTGSLHRLYCGGIQLCSWPHIENCCVYYLWPSCKHIIIVSMSTKINDSGHQTDVTHLVMQAVLVDKQPEECSLLQVFAWWPILLRAHKVCKMLVKFCGQVSKLGPA